MQWIGVCVCVCVCERERERECVHVCECVYECVHVCMCTLCRGSHTCWHVVCLHDVCVCVCVCVCTCLSVCVVSKVEGSKGWTCTITEGMK